MPTLEQWHLITTKILYKLKVDRLCNLLSRLKISPNIITIISVTLGLSSVLFLFNNQFLFILFILLAALLDVLDGFYARTFGNSTWQGELLDHGGDGLVSLVILLKCVFYLQSIYSILALAIWIIFTLYGFIKGTIRTVPPFRLFIIFLMFNLYDLGFIIYSLRQLYALFVLIFKKDIKKII